MPSFRVTICETLQARKIVNVEAETERQALYTAMDAYYGEFPEMKSDPAFVPEHTERNLHVVRTRFNARRLKA